MAGELRDDYLFGEVTDAALRKHLRYGDEANKLEIVIFRSFDEPEVVYGGVISAESLTPFLQLASVPLIVRDSLSLV